MNPPPIPALDAAPNALAARTRAASLRRVYGLGMTLVLVLVLGNVLTRLADNTQAKIAAAERAQASLAQAVSGSAGFNATELRLAAEVLNSDAAADGRRTQILYLGNSQVVTVVGATPADLRSAQWLELMLARDRELASGFHVRLGALGGMNVPEMFLRLIAAGEKRPRESDIAVLAVSPEQFRKLGIREELATQFRSGPLQLQLRELMEHNPDLPRVRSILQPLISDMQPSLAAQSLPAKSSAPASGLEGGLQRLAAKWPLFDAREAVQKTLDYKLMDWRNRLLGINTAKARPIPAEMYRANLEVLEMAARYAEAERIHLVLYMAPLRPKEPRPYLASDRAQLRTDLAALAEKHHLAFFDYTDLVPDELYGNVVHDELTLDRSVAGEPDFVHFGGAAHKIVAEHLFADLRPRMAAWRQAQAGAGK
jgi:hypothetical protein